MNAICWGYAASASVFFIGVACSRWVMLLGMVMMFAMTAFTIVAVNDDEN